MKVIYPGSFDPITKGHMNMIEKASKIFGEVVVAIMHNSKKSNGLLTIPERLELISEIYKDVDNVKVLASDKLTVDVAEENECKLIIRGIRNVNDYTNETDLQKANYEISNGKVDTVCLFPDSKYEIVSSSLVRELLAHDKDVSKYVHPIVNDKLLSKKIKKD